MAETIDRVILDEINHRNLYEVARLSGMVVTNAAELKTDFPGTVKRFRNPVGAWRAMRSIARKDHIEGRVVKWDSRHMINGSDKFLERLVRGVCTVVFDQHQTTQSGDLEVTGANIAFWLTKAARDKERIATAEALTQEALSLVERRDARQLTGNPTAIYALLREENDASRELADLMTPVGDPAVWIDASTNPEEVTDEHERQLFILER